MNCDTKVVFPSLTADKNSTKTKNRVHIFPKSQSQTENGAYRANEQTIQLNATQQTFFFDRKAHRDVRHRVGRTVKLKEMPVCELIIRVSKNVVAPPLTKNTARSSASLQLP